MQASNIVDEADRDLPFGKALAEYLRRRDSGERVDREDFIANHGNVESKLREYFDAADEVELLIGDDLERSPTQDHRFPRRFGDFELLGEIARGGRGVVYRALQISLNRLVAVKMILQGHLAARADIERFWSEARAVARLQHPNIVAIYDVGEHDGQQFFSMELINGQSLADLVRDRPLPSRTAAGYAAVVAHAIQYAHEQGLLHRDLKPSNILVNSMDHVKVTDFGFAKHLQSAVSQTITGQVLGTPSYMPPEQALGEHDSLGPECDVYSIGAVLYELLTGHPPFRAESTLETLRQVIESEAPSARTINSSVPRDLDTISLKCLSKNPSHRYGSARELADDLERFIHDKPIVARPPSISGRVWRWSRRNRGWTAAILFALTALLSLGVGGVVVSNALSVSSGRESLLRLQSIEPKSGWRERMWNAVTDASIVGRDQTLQGHATLALGGVDARMRRRFEGLSAEQVVWNKDGTQLLMSAITNAAPQTHILRIWNVETNDVMDLPSHGNGPIGFSSDGQPIQLVVDEDGAQLVLHALVDERILRKLDLPKDWHVLEQPSIVMTDDGRCVAAVVRDPESAIHLAVWREAESQPKTIAANCAEIQPVLALAADGSHLAFSKLPGQVLVIKVEDGSQLALLRTGRNVIHTVEFSRDLRQSLDLQSVNPSFEWIVAIGDAGGQIAVWDLQTQSPRAFFHGSLHDVYQIAFSPDGMTMASSGRGPSRLWDIATGKQLLEIASNDYAIAMSFAPDGTRLAIGSITAFSPGDTQVWELEFGRGIQNLRGLSGPVSKLNFSQDGSTICALSHEWRAGVWNLQDGTLRATFDLIPGHFADNAAVALTGDGSQLAYCAGSTALLIDVPSRKVVKKWDLPDGLVDLIAVTSPKDILLIRTEMENNRRCTRIRNLLADSPGDHIATIVDFPRHVFGATVGPHGPYLIVDGLGGANGDLRLLRVYDLKGTHVASIPTTATRDFSTMAVDESGMLATSLIATPPHRNRIAMFELPSGEVKQQLSRGPLCLSSAASLYAVGGGEILEEHGISLCRIGADAKLITFDVAVEEPYVAAFGQKGRLLAWGRQDGTVCVANLPNVNRRLRELGLGW